MGHFISSRTSLKAAAVLLVLGSAMSAGGCQPSGAQPRAEPVDQSQPAPPRRGSY